MAVLGVVLGLIGFAGCGMNYPIYKKKLEQGKAKYAYEIVELAREARINKGTFYLHYTDIFDLYQKTIRRQMEAGFESADYFADFFDDPKRFCDQLTASFTSNLAVLDVLGKEESGAFTMMAQTLDLLRDKLYATGRIRRCPANDIKLDALFGALLICKPRYEREHGDEMDRIMLSMISNFKAD